MLACLCLSDRDSMVTLIIKIRNLRAEYKVPAGKRVKVLFKTKNQGLLEAQKKVIMDLARLEEIDFVDQKPDKAAGDVVEKMEIYLPLEDLIDTTKEKIIRKFRG